MIYYDVMTSVELF